MDSPNCQICGCECEGHEHIFWRSEDCIQPRTHMPVIEQPPFFRDLLDQKRNEAICWSHCGIHLCDEELMALRHSLCELPPVVASEVRAPRASAAVIDGFVVARTDGSAMYPTISLLRRAGVGIFYSTNSDANISCPLSGIDQSNNRAELTAILIVMSVAARPTEPRSDSWWAIRRCCLIQSGATPQENWEHCDLWRQIAGHPDVQRRWVDDQGRDQPYFLFT